MPKYYARISGRFELVGYLTAENRLEAIDKLKEEGFNGNVEKHELLGTVEILELEEAEEKAEQHAV